MPCPGSPLLSDVPKNFPGSHSSRWSTETCSQPAQLPPRADFHPLAVPTSNLTSAFLQTQPTALARLHLLPLSCPWTLGRGGCACSSPDSAERPREAGAGGQHPLGWLTWSLP